VSDLLNEGVAAFLRRADRINLHEAAIAEVTASYSELFNQGGISISPDLVQKAAEATEGYPFLIQLVGYYLWLEADKAGWKLDVTSVQRGIAAAQRRNILVVVESALSDISDRDREFLDAMAIQDGPSAAGQIGALLKAKPNVVSKIPEQAHRRRPDRVRRLRQSRLRNPRTSPIPPRVIDRTSLIGSSNAGVEVVLSASFPRRIQGSPARKASGRAFPESDVHAAGLDRKNIVGCIFRLSAVDGRRIEDQVGEGQAIQGAKDSYSRDRH
jgi:hypothetical protein